MAAAGAMAQGNGNGQGITTVSRKWSTSYLRGRTDLRHRCGGWIDWRVKVYGKFSSGDPGRRRRRQAGSGSHRFRIVAAYHPRRLFFAATTAGLWTFGNRQGDRQERGEFKGWKAVHSSNLLAAVPLAVFVAMLCHPAAMARNQCVVTSASAWRRLRCWYRLTFRLRTSGSACTGPG